MSGTSSQRRAVRLARFTGCALVFVVWATLFSPLFSQPPDGLVVDGVPEIPDSIQLATAPYWTATANIFLGWDPQTGGMLINSETKETRQLELLLSPGGQTKFTTQFAESIGNSSFMPKLGDKIVFSSDHSGDEFYQLYGLDAATNQTQLLTDGESLNTNTIYDHTGKQIAFLSMMPAGQYPDIHVMNPRNMDSRRIIMSPGTGGWMLEDWAHDGCHILACHLTYYGGYFWSINTATGETQLLTKELATQRLYLAARYTPDDNGLYVIVLGQHFSRTIDYLPLNNSGVVRKIPSGVTSAYEIELSPDGTWLAYVTDDDDAERFHLFNTVTGEELPQLALEPAYFGGIRWKEDSSEIGFNYGSSAMPFQAYSYKIATRELLEWTKPDAPLTAEIIKPELVKIRSFDQLEISGYLYRPDPKLFPGKRPVIISIHGGPAAEYRPEFLGSYNYYLDTLGVALLYPNVRGSTGFGPLFESLDNGYKREDSVKDIGAFLDWVVTDPRLDSSRIGVQGGSYGGYMTLATLIHYGNQVRCGSDLMGISDFVTLIHHTTKFRLAAARAELGDERYPEMNKFLESISPLNHAAEIHDPVMITAGKNDPRVPESESDQMMKAIRAQNGIVWYLLGENEGHGFRRVSDQKYQFAAEAFFFQTYLLPKDRLTPLGPAAPAAAPMPSTDSSGPD